AGAKFNPRFGRVLDDGQRLRYGCVFPAVVDEFKQPCPTVTRDATKFGLLSHWLVLHSEPRPDLFRSSVSPASDAKLGGHVASRLHQLPGRRRHAECFGHFLVRKDGLCPQRSHALRSVARDARRERLLVEAGFVFPAAHTWPPLEARNATI